nr:MAG TPA: tail tape measure protein [Herelleviridae sp.]
MKNSLGSAIQENNRYMESLSAQTNLLKATFQDFATNVVSKEMITTLLGLANNVLTALNTEVGTTITQWTLLTGVFTGGLVIFGQIAAKLVIGAKAVTNLGGALSTLFTAFTTGGVSAASFASAVLPVAAILAGVVAGVYALHRAWEEANPSLESAQNELQGIDDRLNELESIPWADRTTDINREIASLQEAKSNLEEYIATLEQANKEAYAAEFEDKYTTPAARQQYGFGFAGMTMGYLSENLTQEEAVKQATERFKELGYAVDDLNRVFNENANEWQNVEDLLIVVDEKFQDSTATINGYGLAYSGYLEKLDKGFKLTGEEAQSFVELQDKISGAITDLQKLGEANDGLNPKQEQLLNYLTALQSGFDDYNKVLYDSSTLIVDVMSGTSMTEAQVRSLEAAYPGLSQAVEYNNGVYTVNKEKLAEVLTQTGLTTQKLYELITAQNAVSSSQLDLSQQIQALMELGTIAGGVAESIAMIGNVNTKDVERTIKGYLQTGKAKSYEEARRMVLGNIYKSMFTGAKTSVVTPTGVGARTGTGTKTGTKSPSDLALEEFKNLQKDAEHQTEMGVTTQEKYYDKLESLIAQYKDKATAHMKEYGLTTDEINRNMYQYEEEIYKGRAKLAEDLKDQQEKATKESIENQKQMWQDYLDTLQSEKSKMDSVIGYATEYASRQISDIEDELSAVQDEIDAVNARYDEKIDKLNETNDALEEEIKREKLLQDLATAKSKVAMVFKNGRFQYVQDADAISAAQAALDEFDRNKVLEEQKKFIESQRALDLQDLLNKQEALNQEKKQWEEYKDGWSGLASEYEFQQNKLIAEQEYGIDIENSNWATRLDNLESFKQDYISKLNEIKAAQEALNNLTEQLNKPQTTTKPTTGGGGTMSASEMNDILFGGGSVGDDGLHLDTDKFYGVDYDDLPNTPSGAGTGQGPSASDIWENTPGWDLVGFANGTTSAPGGLAMVGENGPELRVLGQGDGVIPADITRNLWDWGKINPSNLAARAVNYMFNIDNLSLPNARDATSLVDGLKQMAYQRAYKRA